MENYPSIGTLVEVRQWAQRNHADDHRVTWKGGDPVSIQATVTGVVTRYNGDFVPEKPARFSLLGGTTDDYEPGALVNRQAVKLLAVRCTPESKEQLVWDWRVL
jgi:hypothetical protein